MGKFIKKLMLYVRKFDLYLRRYEHAAQIPAIPAEAFVKMGLYWANLGEVEKAKTEFETAAAMSNPSPEAYVNLGIYYAQKERYEEAIKSFRKAIKLDRYNARAYSLWASVLIEINDFETAEKFYKIAVKLNSRDSDLYLNWGIALAKQKKRDEAEDKFKKACFYNPLNYNAQFLWGVILTEQKKYEAALVKFNIVLLYAPNHADAFYYLAICNSKIGEYELAKKLCARALALNPQKCETYVLAAEIDLQLGCGEELLSYYQSAVENQTESLILYESWAQMLQHFERYEEAKNKNLEILQIDSLNEQALYNLSLCEFKLNNIQESLNTLEKLIEFYPNNFEAKALMGKIYDSIGEYDLAIDIFYSVISNSNKHYNLYFDLANAYYAQNNYENAQKYYSKAIEYFPDMLYAYVNYAKLLCETGDVQAALRKIRKAYSLDKNSIAVLLNYGAILLKASKFKDAIEKFETVLEKCDSPQAKLGCAEAYFYLKNYEKSMEILEQISAVFIETLDFRRLMFNVYFKLAQNSNSAYNIEQALHWCAKVEELDGDDIDVFDKKLELREMSKQN